MKINLCYIWIYLSGTFQKSQFIIHLHFICVVDEKNDENESNIDVDSIYLVMFIVKIMKYCY